MDRKSLIVLLICFVLFILWGQVMSYLYPPKPQPLGTNTLALTNVTAATNPIVTVEAPLPVSAPNLAAVVAPGAPEETQVLSNEFTHFTFTSHGGGVKSVTLLKYPESVTCFGRKGRTRGRGASLNTGAPLPILALLGDEALRGDGLYRLSTTQGGVRAEKQMSNGLYVVRDFRLASNYLLQATVQIENRGGQPVALAGPVMTAGTATTLDAEDDESLVGLYWYDGAKSHHIDQGWFANKTLGCFPGTPRAEYREGQNNIAWSAVHNHFFTLAVMPKEPASQIVAHRVNLPPASREDRPAAPRARTNQFGLQTSLLYAPTNLGPGQVWQREYFVFAGPLEYRTLDRIGNQFKNNVDLVMGYGGFFGFFAKVLLLSMNGIHSLFGGRIGYGWVIIIITVLLKLLFWPLTQASTRSMKRMQSLQPQVKIIQEKFKDDPAKMQQKMMALWKEHKVSPLSGCLPMLVQIPVFIGFFTMVRSAIELRGAQFLWACDLSRPDTLFYLLGFPVNPLSLLMGVTMLWQARLTPPSPGMDPAQQKIMKYMPLMFLFLLYNYSAGLTLYWTVQNLLTIAQTKLTRSREAPAAPTPVTPAVPPRKKK